MGLELRIAVRRKGLEQAVKKLLEEIETNPAGGAELFSRFGWEFATALSRLELFDEVLVLQEQGKTFEEIREILQQQIFKRLEFLPGKGNAAEALIELTRLQVAAEFLEEDLTPE